MATAEEKITQMYDKQLQRQTEQLKTDYDSGNEKLDVQKQEIQKQAQKNVDAVRVDAAKRAFNAAERENAAGLTSGARAQASLSRGNQLQSNISQIRAAEQEADAQLERQRALFAKEYTAAIRQAQADNDLAKAQALYAQAQAEDAALEQARQAAATKERQEQMDYAKYMADNGDTSYWEALLGIEPKDDTVDAAMKKLLEEFPNKVITDYQKWTNAVNDYGINTLKKYGLSSGYFNTYEINPGGATDPTEEIKKTLKAAYPSGIVTDREMWNDLVHEYGKDVVLGWGYRPRPGHRGVVWDENDRLTY